MRPHPQADADGEGTPEWRLVRATLSLPSQGCPEKNYYSSPEVLTLIVSGSRGQRFAGEGPAEGLGEVGDKCLDALFE